MIKVELEFRDKEEISQFIYLIQTAQHFLDTVISLWGGNQNIYDDSTLLTNIKWELKKALKDD